MAGDPATNTLPSFPDSGTEIPGPAWSPRFESLSRSMKTSSGPPNRPSNSEANQCARNPTPDAQPLSLDVLLEGIVAPLTSLAWGKEGKPGTFDGGAYHADGSVCARSLHRKVNFINQPRPLTSLESFPRVRGVHLYGGILKNEHFGHFLIESLSRLWALNRVEQALESIVFYARYPSQPVPKWAHDLLAIVAPGIAVSIVSRPTVFETLVVADQAAHSVNCCIYGHPWIRDVFAPLREMEGASFEKLYVSRSKLNNAGGFFCERWLEDVLAADGFVTVHPEEYTVREQIALYNGAKSLIFAEGSALHLFALTCRMDQKAYIIQRRKNASIFEWQLRTFGVTPVVGPEAPSAYFIPERSGRDTLLARVKIDFGKLREQLAANGFTSGADRLLPDETLIRQEIECIESHIGQRLVEHHSDAL